MGRDEEIAALQAAVGRVAGGEPCVVVLTGPPGVGKTRLARETLKLAEDSGYTAMAGRAHPLSREVAYAPLIEALGPCLRGMAPPRRAGYVGDLPQLGLLFGGLGLEPPVHLADPALERARLSEGVTRLMDRLSSERPVALLIDDGDASDGATLAALRYLTVSLSDRPVLLLITKRDGAGGPDSVDALVDGLRGSVWRVERLRLEPLRPERAEALVGAIMGPSAEPGIRRRVVDRCGGIPLYLRAVAQALVDDGWRSGHPGAPRHIDAEMPLPADVTDRLAPILESATRQETRMLTLLAVADGGLDQDILLHAAGLERAEALEAVDALHRRGLLEFRPSGGCELSHGLLREVILARCTPPAVARAHAEVFHALVALSPDDVRIAEHTVRAGAFIEAGAAFGHLLAAARRARRLGASEDAIRYCTTALELARRQDRPGAVTALLGDLAGLWSALARNDRGAACWKEAAAEYTRQGDATGIARANRELAMLEWSRADLEAAARHLAVAESALEGLEPSSEQAELLHARTMVATRLGDADQVRANAEALRKVARRLGSHPHAAQAHLAEAIVAGNATDYEAMAECTRRGLEEAIAGGEPALVARAHDQASIAAAYQGDVDALRRHSVASLGVGRDVGALALQLWPRARIAVADLLVGDWDAALRGTSEVLGMTQRLGTEAGMQRGTVSALATHAWVLVHLGRLAEAHSCLQEARRTAPAAMEADRNIFAVVDTAAGMLTLADGDPATAVRVCAGLQDLRSGWFPLLSAAVFGEAQAFSGDTASAHQLAGRLRAVVSCTTQLPAALASWIEGLAYSQEGQRQRAAAALLAAASGFDGLNLPFWTARAELAAARNVAQAEAIEHGREALKTFDRLGALIQSQEARQLLRSLGVVPSRGRPRRDTGSPLSARELEVARLVAHGLSNAEVATRLFLSPRTVTTHLDHIYSRLKLTSRTALTRYLADSGLLEGDNQVRRVGG